MNNFIRRAIKSFNSNKVYLVEFKNDRWNCTCKDFEFGALRDTTYECKHILKVKMQLNYEESRKD